MGYKDCIEYRKFRFGKNRSDYLSTNLLVKNMEKDECENLIRLMPSSREYFEGLLSQLQKDGYVVVEK